jgi:hypothetical protein
MHGTYSLKIQCYVDTYIASLVNSTFLLRGLKVTLCIKVSCMVMSMGGWQIDRPALRTTLAASSLQSEEYGKEKKKFTKNFQ